jgi:VWFA-related protein
MISRRTLLLGSSLGLWAQDPKFSAGVEVVTLLATVRDREGRIVKDLDRNDFVLLDAGKVQKISYFSRESDLPLAIGLLVDTSRSQLGVMEAERKASCQFLDQVLRENTDEAFVAHFDTIVEVLQGFTSSRGLLTAALEKLRVPGQLATLYYDAVRDCSERQMRGRQGRKAFIVLSDGVDYRSKAPLGTAIEYAQRADVMVYSILFADKVRLYRPGRAAVQAVVAKRGRNALQRMSQETGGAFYEVSEKQPLEEVFSAIEDALRNQYSIGYTPADQGKSGVYRKIKLSTTRPGLLVQTRDGYYAK